MAELFEFMVHSNPLSYHVELFSHGSEIAQYAKKFIFNSVGLMDFAVSLVDSVHHLPDGQVTFH